MIRTGVQPSSGVGRCFTAGGLRIVQYRSVFSRYSRLVLTATIQHVTVTTLSRFSQS